MGKLREVMRKTAKHLNLSPSNAGSSDSEKGVECDKKGVDMKVVSKCSDEDNFVLKTEDIPNIVEFKQGDWNQLSNNDNLHERNVLLEEKVHVVSDSESEISDSSGFEEIEIDDENIEEMTIHVAESINKVPHQVIYPTENIARVQPKVICPTENMPNVPPKVKCPIENMPEFPSQVISPAENISKVPSQVMCPTTENKHKQVSEDVKSKPHATSTKKPTKVIKTGVFVMNSDENSSDDDFEVSRKKRGRPKKKDRRTYSNLADNLKKAWKKKTQLAKERREKREIKTKRMREAKSAAKGKTMDGTAEPAVTTTVVSSGADVEKDTSSVLQGGEDAKETDPVDTGLDDLSGAANSESCRSGQEANDCEDINDSSNNSAAQKKDDKTSAVELPAQVEIPNDTPQGSDQELPAQVEIPNDTPQGSDQEDFICGECKQYFVSLASLRKHLKTHSDQTTESAKGTRFGSKVNITHNLQVEDKAQFVCGICQLQTRTADELGVHVQTHALGYKFLRNVFDQSLSSLVTLQEHIKTHLPQTEEFVCGVCSSTFTSVAALEAHMGTHSTVPVSTTDTAIMKDFDKSPPIKKSPADSSQHISDHESAEKDKSVTIKQKDKSPEGVAAQDHHQKTPSEKNEDSVVSKALKKDSQKGAKTTIVSQLLKYKPPSGLFFDKD